jgi:hypothetical protein
VGSTATAITILFKSTAAIGSVKTGPFQDSYVAMVAKSELLNNVMRSVADHRWLAAVFPMCSTEAK